RRAAAAAAAPTRSPSTLRRLLKDVEKELAALRRKQARLTEALIGVVDHEALARTGAELAEIDAAVAAAEERWLGAATELDDT
nr:hypothetical protein [Acidimicrobiia bacterium]